MIVVHTPHSLLKLAQARMVSLVAAFYFVSCGFITYTRFRDQAAVEKASMTQVDHSSFTPQQLAVEKLIKEQNFTWKVRDRCATRCPSSNSVKRLDRYDTN